MNVSSDKQNEDGTRFGTAIVGDYQVDPVRVLRERLPGESTHEAAERLGTLVASGWDIRGSEYSEVEASTPQPESMLPDILPQRDRHLTMVASAAMREVLLPEGALASA